MTTSKAGARVIVGMSGGVDSSVAALLLKEQGYDVHALFMKNWEEDDSAGLCTAAEDLADAQSVCDQLNIPLHTVNFSAEYWDRVFEYFLAELEVGRTPNPDVMCNKEIKFKAFIDHARTLGAEYIATGHYAGNITCHGKHYLIKGADNNKDQSYFLYALNQEQLARALFPLANISKEEVRTIAERENFANHDKKDSTGICFIGERNFNQFLKRYLPEEPGDIVTPEGEVIGQHNGLMYYTIGQRQGLGIGGSTNGNGQPWYVADKDTNNNKLIVVQDHEHPLLLADCLLAEDIHWITEQAPELPFNCKAKVRYRQTDQDCTILVGNDHNEYVIVFNEQQRAITPGQSIVFYLEDQCLGGGIINRVLMNEDHANGALINSSIHSAKSATN
ncbi:MAG: tRNA 2-thiouridine(34) synthase MnmA [Gammaproteobacteria bacterium]|nr:tRNA 2-thiouridine(34) synthase MnmA [Gammaproteobacteria bacterium]